MGSITLRKQQEFFMINFVESTNSQLYDTCNNNNGDYHGDEQSYQFLWRISLLVYSLNPIKEMI